MFDALSNSKPSRASVVLLLRFIREDINEFASCEKRTKSSKNLKIMLFHYSQLDFRKCLKAPKTVQK